MKSFKEQCIALRKQDYSINEIIKITGRPKTSVYFHIKNIPLSAAKKKDISYKLQTTARELARKRKGISKKEFKKIHSWTPESVLLLAHLIFDGEILKKRCVYNNRSQNLLDRFSKLMLLFYDYPPRIHQNKKTGVTRLQYSNVALAQHLFNKASDLNSEIRELPKSCQKEFLRAFFDDEGCMDYRVKSKKRRVRGYQKNQKVLAIVQILLKGFGIESSLQGKNEVVISGKENLIKFQKEINFSDGVRINPKRANSIWKKPIEKRDLLDMAIKSFKI